MHRLRSVQLLLALFAAPVLAANPAIGYAQATGYYKQGTRPTLYQPLNLLDGRELTAWCSSGGDFLDEWLTFGFKDGVVVDEVRIYTGNGFDDSTFKEFGRGKKFALEGPEGAQSFTVADVRGQQSVALNPPVTGAHMKLELLEAYNAEDPESPVCVTDIVFYSNGKPLNGPWLTRSLKYDRARAPILGTWFGGDEGAPDHFLAFYIDGTFRLLVAPHDPQKPKRQVRGKYTISGESVRLEINGQGKKSARALRTEKGRGRGLTLEGALPAEFQKSWRSWQ